LKIEDAKHPEKKKREREQAEEVDLIYQSIEL